MNTEPTHALKKAVDLASEYLTGIGDQRVGPDEHSLQGLASLDIELPEAPQDPGSVLGELHAHGSPATIVSAGPRYYGFVIGGVVPAALGASVLASAWDQNTGMQVCTPVGAKLEEISSRWLLDLLRFDPACGVGFVTGATVANFTAICAARHRLLANKGWDVEQDGLFDAPTIRVVVGEQVHASVKKALSLAGFGRARVETVAADDQGRIIPSEIPNLDDMTLLCLQAGEVNSGAFDSFTEIIGDAKNAGAWVHVDGAFGLWARSCAEFDALTEGLNLADSWAADAHKWLNVPYDSGLVICRDREAIVNAMTIKAPYLDDKSPYEPCWFTPELSRRARGTEVYAALRSLGRSGVSDMISRCCGHARRFASQLETAGFEILNDVVLNQVLVRFGDDQQTRRAIELIQRDGTCWAGGTTWQGKHAMRISVSSWATTDDDVTASLEAMIRSGRQAQAS
ncbi:MAG: aspartate aminotransferase family protein [Phycisphaera sp.]|nr:MAG: aspartate aminotransferase family protein [Phycisphaera sp.]